jgi:hypothetical protein
MWQQGLYSFSGVLFSAIHKFLSHFNWLDGTQDGRKVRTYEDPVEIVRCDNKDWVWNPRVQLDVMRHFYEIQKNPEQINLT